MTEIIKLPGGRAASYRVIGTGIPALLFPAGPGLASTCMTADAELFPTVLRSYLIDPPGAGSSTPPQDAADYSPAWRARFYEQVRTALGLGKVVAFGHSQGATAALAYAASYPRQTAACVAVAPVDIPVPLDRISCRTLVIAGELDPSCVPAQARHAVEGIRQSDFVTLPGCGHLPALDTPAEYRQVILDFLRSCDSAPASSFSGCR